MNTVVLILYILVAVGSNTGPQERGTKGCGLMGLVKKKCSTQLKENILRMYDKYVCMHFHN